MFKRITKILATGIVLTLLIAVSCKSKKAVKTGTAPVIVNEITTPATAPDTVVESIKVPLNNHVVQQHNNVKPVISFYESAYDEMQQMLQDYKPLDFKRAVFITENAYFGDFISYETFNKQIDYLSGLCKNWMRVNSLKDYHYPDSINVLKNYAIFKVMKDTIYLIDSIILHYPYHYDFNDFLGEKDWTNQFVIKLLSKGEGNCHSLPYLYKILANELNAQAYLSLAPNHIYLKHRNKKLGWYNTELTSGEFPTDAWIKASGYITIEAIRSSIYMDTLSQSQSIALCVFDLAKGYQAQTRNYSDGFIIKCCDLSLRYFPNNINAIILKAETIRRQYDQFVAKKQNTQAEKALKDMQTLYFQGLQLGYREMPKKMYLEWLTSVREQRERYTNFKINETYKTHTK